VVVVLRGADLYPWPTKWVLYRLTTGALKRDKNLFLSGAGPYAPVDRPGPRQSP